MTASSDEEDENSKAAVHKLLKDKNPTHKLLPALTERLLNAQLEAALKSLTAGANILKAIAYTHSIAIPRALKDVAGVGHNKVLY